MDQIVVAEWQLSQRELIRVTLAEFKGWPVFHVRVWYRDHGGSLKPGKKGLTLGVGQLPRLATSLEKALAEAVARRLIPNSNQESD